MAGQISSGKISSTRDAQNKRFVFRLTAQPEGVSPLWPIGEAFKSVDDPWNYDVLIDMRRYNSIMSLDDLYAFARFWRARMQERDQGRRVVLISSDPFIKIRLKEYQRIFPYRQFALFDTFDEGLDWLNQPLAA